MRIDAHQHFWKLERGDYSWLTTELGPIYRDFLPGDLEPLLKDAGIDGTILIQASDTVAETEFMLSLADDHEWILGVVGWVDMEADDASDTIRKLAENPKFAGIRPMIQDIEDPLWMLKPHLAPAIETLIELGLTFDALVLARHLDPLKSFLSRYSELPVIIDHCAKPEIRNRTFQPWADDMAEIAQSSSAYCKLSGLLTEAVTDWRETDIVPYADHVLKSFGPRRTVFGSDWPVLNLAGTYSIWMDLVLNQVSEELRGGVLGANARRFYLDR